jgi:predicted nucleic acid-binding protein
MLYLDTSVLVAAVSNEVATARVHDWLEHQAEPFAISDWSLAEFASALAAKQRAQELSSAERAGGLQWLRTLSGGGAVLWPVSREAFRRAANLVNTAGVKVRASDALHLAVVEEFGATLCTLDAEQAEAGNMVAIRALSL